MNSTPRAGQLAGAILLTLAASSAASSAASAAELRTFAGTLKLPGDFKTMMNEFEQESDQDVLVATDEKIDVVGSSGALKDVPLRLLVHSTWSKYIDAAHVETLVKNNLDRLLNKSGASAATPVEIAGAKFYAVSGPSDAKDPESSHFAELIGSVDTTLLQVGVSVPKGVDVNLAADGLKAFALDRPSLLGQPAAFEAEARARVDGRSMKTAFAQIASSWGKPELDSSTIVRDGEGREMLRNTMFSMPDGNLMVATTCSRRFPTRSSESRVTREGWPGQFSDAIDITEPVPVTLGGVEGTKRGAARATESYTKRMLHWYGSNASHDFGLSIIGLKDKNTEALFKQFAGATFSCEEDSGFGSHSSEASP